jgi:Flp pilus assembly protein TadG
VVNHAPSPTRAAPRPWQDLPRKRGGGQALVEFAIALPILMLLVAGVVELGRGYVYATAASDAARDGARYVAGKTALTNGPGLASMCSIITADLASVTPAANVSCPTLIAHAPPFVSGADYTNPSGGQAVVVVYCGTSLNCQGTPNPRYQSEIDVYVYYGFDDLNLFGGKITLSGSSKTTTSW